MTADVVELTRQVAALTKRVEELERGVTVHVRYPDGPLHGAVVDVTNSAMVDVRDGHVRVSSPDGVPVVVRSAGLVIEEGGATDE